MMLRARARFRAHIAITRPSAAVANKRRGMPQPLVGEPRRLFRPSSNVFHTLRSRDRAFSDSRPSCAAGAAT